MKDKNATYAIIETDSKLFSLFSGWRPNETSPKQLVWDADPWPDPPAHAQPLARWDDLGQRAEVRTAVSGAAWSAIHARRIPGDHQQAHAAQVRQCRLCLSQVHFVIKSR